MIAFTQVAIEVALFVNHAVLNDRIGPKFNDRLVQRFRTSVKMGSVLNGTGLSGFLITGAVVDFSENASRFGE